jgi:hypothetical protein
MNRILTMFFVAIVTIMMGCTHVRYRVYAYNGTPSKITDTKVTLSNGEALIFGTMDPAVNKGMWPVVGPLGKESTVEWVDTAKKRKSAKAVVLCRHRDDSVIFLINPNGTVTVETGRELYGHKKAHSRPDEPRK